MFPPLRLKAALSLGGLTVRQLLERTWRQANTHEIMTRAAAVSFYAMLALVPFLGLVLTLTAQLLPDVTGSGGKTVGIGNLTTEELRSTLRATIPPEAYKVVEDQIARLQNQTRPNLGLLIAGLGVTIWLASSLFLAIIDAMNRIYGVTETRSYPKIYLTAFLMTVIQAVILIGSLLAIVLWPQIVGWLGYRGTAALAATVVQWLVICLMIILSFALTFYVAPDADQSWEWITPGSFVGLAVFLAASFGFQIYVQNFANYDKTYGSLGGVMVLLFWFWISSLVVLASAQMNKVIEDASPLGKNYGQRVDATEPLDLKAITPESVTAREHQSPGA